MILKAAVHSSEGMRRSLCLSQPTCQARPCLNDAIAVQLKPYIQYTSLEANAILETSGRGSFIAPAVGLLHYGPSCYLYDHVCNFNYQGALWPALHTAITVNAAGHHDALCAAMSSLQNVSVLKEPFAPCSSTGAGRQGAWKSLLLAAPCSNTCACAVQGCTSHTERVGQAHFLLPLVLLQRDAICSDEMCA